MNIKFSRFFIMLALIIASVISCRKEESEATYARKTRDYSSDVIQSWNQLFLEIEQYAGGYRPGPAPRALAYLGIACYEACIAGTSTYNSIESQFSGLNLPKAKVGDEYHWPTVVNEVSASLMAKFFPTASAKIETLRKINEEKFKSDASFDVLSRSASHGSSVALVIWDWSKTDAVGHDAYKDPFGTYNWQAVYKKAGDWKATIPGPGKPMFPFWGNARAFAITQNDKICRPPLAYSESTRSAYYSQAIEVYSQNTPTLSHTTEWIGEFWSDDLVNLTFSPGPRWMAIANQVYAIEKSSLETALVCNAKVGMALNDAAVGCWNSKYYYNVERPVTYIQKVIDPTWKPALQNPLTGETGISPSFPAYPSGHSTMGAAGAEALASVFGYSYAMTDKCHQNRTEFEGTPRSFGSFYEMAQENAWSRVPLGVHWRMDCEEGVRYGTEIGRKINNLPWKK